MSECKDKASLAHLNRADSIETVKFISNCVPVDTIQTIQGKPIDSRRNWFKMNPRFIYTRKQNTNQTQTFHGRRRNNNTNHLQAFSKYNYGSDRTNKGGYEHPTNEMNHKTPEWCSQLASTSKVAEVFTMKPGNPGWEPSHAGWTAQNE